MNVVKNAHNAAEVVNQVRDFLEKMFRSKEDQDCPVCFVILGSRHTNHASGANCPQGMCKRYDSDWTEFQQQIQFPEKDICWGCYLPTVSGRTSRKYRSLIPRHLNQKKLPGARDHQYKECPTPHIVRPGLFAFWERAPAELRDYVWTRLNFSLHDLPAFTRWLAARNRNTQLPNHILLFWWIIDYWET